MNQVVPIKVIIIGDASVGKTCLVSQYINKVFEKTQATVVPAFYAKELRFPSKNRILKLNFWDSAGGEKYRSLTRVYYRGTQVALLCCDCTEEESYISLQNYWIKEITSLPEYEEGRLVIGIFVTKMDRTPTYDIKRVRHLAVEYNAIYAETSSKEDTGINEGFQAIYMKLMKLIDQGNMEKRQSIGMATTPVDESNKNDQKKSCCS